MPDYDEDGMNVDNDDFDWDDEQKAITDSMFDDADLEDQHLDYDDD